MFARTVRPEREGDNIFSGRSTNGALVYAIGDVHGSADLLYELLKEISVDVRQCPPQVPIHVVFVGDYIDWGSKSRQVIDALVALQSYPAWKTHFLKGDHEELLLRFIERPSDGWHWLEQGGHATIDSYGVECPYRPRDMKRLRDQLIAAMGPEHLMFLRGLQRYWRQGDYVFSHAGVRPGRALGEQEDEDLLWMRPDAMDMLGPDPSMVVIHGHTVSKDIMVGPHRICIDTGAYVNHKLSSARIFDDQILLISASKSGSTHLHLNRMAEPGLDAPHLMRKGSYPQAS